MGLYSRFVVFRSVQMVGVCQVRMMRCLFMVASLMMFGCFFVMLRS
jgi:hypothetical protein